MNNHQFLVRIVSCKSVFIAVTNHTEPCLIYHLQVTPKVASLARQSFIATGIASVSEDERVLDTRLEHNSHSLATKAFCCVSFHRNTLLGEWSYAGHCGGSLIGSLLATISGRKGRVVVPDVIRSRILSEFVFFVAGECNPGPPFAGFCSKCLCASGKPETFQLDLTFTPLPPPSLLLSSVLTQSSCHFLSICIKSDSLTCGFDNTRRRGLSK